MYYYSAKFRFYLADKHTDRLTDADDRSTQASNKRARACLSISCLNRQSLKLFSVNWVVFVAETIEGTKRNFTLEMVKWCILSGKGGCSDGDRHVPSSQSCPWVHFHNQQPNPTHIL